MKSLGDLWEKIVSFENLWLAYRKARRGKGRRPPAMRFALNLERELLSLQTGLAEGSYQPGAYCCSRCTSGSLV